MLPRAWEVGEAEIDSFDLFFTDEGQDFFRRHSSNSKRTTGRMYVERIFFRARISRHFLPLAASRSHGAA